MGLNLPDAGEGIGQVGPGRLVRGDIVVLGEAALQVRRHRNVHFLGVVQTQIVHEADKIALAQLPAQARVKGFLLTHAGSRQALIVVAGVEQTMVGQGKYLGVDGLVHLARVTILKIRPSAPPDQQAIPGESHLLRVEDKTDAARSVPRRGPHTQIPGPEFDPVAMAQ